MKNKTLIPALIIGICIALAGLSMGIGFYMSRSTDRYVTVKGLAEKEVRADLAIWPITFRVPGHTLTALQKDIDTDREAVTAFLKEAGFKQESISYSAPKIRDSQADNRYGNNQKSPYRYLAEATVTVRSPNVELVKKTMEESGKLVARNVVVAAQNWENPTEFLYTSLNSIKPEMIETATKNARRAAAKFAKDSGSRVGKIRRATQGYFSISERDRNSRLEARC